MGVLFVLAWGHDVLGEGSRTVALVPPVDRPSVARGFAEAAAALDLSVKEISPEELVTDAFSPERYPVAIYLGAERYIYQVHEPADGTESLLQYLSQSGVLVAGGFVWPFYRPVAYTQGGFRQLDVNPMS